MPQQRQRLQFFLYPLFSYKDYSSKLVLPKYKRTEDTHWIQKVPFWSQDYRSH